MTARKRKAGAGASRPVAPATPHSEADDHLSDLDDHVGNFSATDVSGDVDTQEAIRAGVAAVTTAQSTSLAIHQMSLNSQEIADRIQARRHVETEFSIRMTQQAQLNNQHGRHVDETLIDVHGNRLRPAE